MPDRSAPSPYRDVDGSSPLPAASVSPSSALPSALPSSSPSAAVWCLSCLHRFRWLLLGLVLLCLLSGLLLPPFLRFLLRVLLELRPTPEDGGLFFVVIVLLCNPVTVGYGLVVLATGVVFGWSAFPIVYSASIVGGALWFSAFRFLSVACGLSSSPAVGLSASLHFRAFSSALEAAPVQSAALLQLSFLPFGALTALLSTTPLSLCSFVLACCLSRLKLIAYVWLAQSANTVQALWTRDRAYDSTELLSLALSVSFSLLSLTLITLFANRQLAKLRQQEADWEAERAAAEAGGGSTDSGQDDALIRILDVERGAQYDRLLSPSRGQRLGDRDDAALTAAAGVSDSSALLPSESRSRKLSASSSSSSSRAQTAAAAVNAETEAAAASHAAVLPASLSLLSPSRLSRSESPSASSLLLLNPGSPTRKLSSSSSRRAHRIISQ